MRAVGVMQFGGPDALEVVELAEPEMRADEVLIRVHAAAVNPTDTYTRNGARADALRASGPPPYVPGMDAAGVVEVVGEAAGTHLQVGDHAMAIVVPSGSRGAYSELIAVPGDSAVRVPAGTTDAQAATLPMNAMTARLALDLLGLRAGATLAVTGAAGAFGGYVVQLAKIEGLRVIADATPADEALVRTFGADVVVSRGPGMVEEIRRSVPDGVDALADGAVLDDAAVGAVRDGGQIATVRGFQPPEPPRGVVFRPVWVREYARKRAKLDELRDQVERGEITLRVAEVVPMERAPDAHRRLEAGGVRGRIVLSF
ncbi:MAG: NADP-dependent oxidoreductase [Acidimicrobiales bacterium]